jgi:hypothetical protein
MPYSDDSFFSEFHFSSFQKENDVSNTNIVNIWLKTMEMFESVSA